MSKKVDGTVYVAEAVPDTRAKRLAVVSAYIKKPSQQTRDVQAPLSDAQNASADDGSIDKLSQIDGTVKENGSPNSDTIGVVRDDFTATLDQDLVNRIDEVAKSLGVRVEFTDGVGGGDADASVSGNVIKMDKNVTRPYEFLMGHEITHYMQGISKDAYEKFEKLALRRISDEYINDTYNRYKEKDGDFTYRKAREEAVADYAGGLISNSKNLDAFIADNRNDKGILGTVRSAVTYLKDRLTGKSKQQAEVAETKLTNAINDVNLENKNTAQTDGEKMHLKKVGNKSVVWIDNNSMTIKQLSDPNFIANYIKQHIGEVYTIIENGYKVYLGPDLPNEYTRSKSTQHMQKHERGKLKAKGKAVSNLGELIETATNKRWEMTRNTKNKDAKYGIYRYDNTFAFPVRNNQGETTGIHAYTVEIVIRNASDGRKYLYDIVNIKEDIATVHDLQLEEARLAAYDAATQSNAYEDSIDDKDETVNNNPSPSSANSGRKSLKLPETEANTPNADIAELLNMLDTEEASEATKLKLEELREKYGVIPKGEKPFREVQVPKKTAKDKYVSQTVRTILEAKATPDEVLPTIEKLIAEGELSFNRYSDNDAIDNIGQTAYTEIVSAVHIDEVTSDSSTVCS